jgi:thiosulfate dehydrogenase [quinone] large subunit
MNGQSMKRNAEAPLIVALERPAGFLEFSATTAAQEALALHRGNVRMRKEIVHMQRSTVDQVVIFYLRMVMAWTFLYPGIREVLSPDFSVAGFLHHTQTFHDFFSTFATPPVASVISVVIAYGHLLIGLLLLVGLMVRLSSSLGVLLMGLYWMAHMDWPYIENKTNFIIDQHLVFAGVLVYLAIARAGRFWGLDGWVQQAPFAQADPIRFLVS